MSEVKRFDHVNHAHVDDCEHIENPEGAWVKASDYDALAAETQALREEVAKLTQYNKSLNEENTRLLVDCEETDKEVVVLRTKLAMAEDAAAKGDAAASSAAAWRWRSRSCARTRPSSPHSRRRSSAEPSRAEASMGQTSRKVPNAMG